jgi:hypothetical protein
MSTTDHDTAEVTADVDGHHDERGSFVVTVKTPAGFYKTFRVTDATRVERPSPARPSSSCWSAWSSPRGHARSQDGATVNLPQRSLVPGAAGGTGRPAVRLRSWRHLATADRLGRSGR